MAGGMLDVSEFDTGQDVHFGPGIRQIVLPATYAGSECNPPLDRTENGAETTPTDRRARAGLGAFSASRKANWTGSPISRYATPIGTRG